jgi:transposase
MLATDHPPGQPPVPPAPLALATRLQADTQVADDAGSAATTMERRWHVGLDGLDAETPPCRTDPRVALRQRLMAQQMDRRLRARPVDRAATSGAGGARPGRAALDRRPRWGAGRVEAPSKLLGHARRKAWSVSARQPGRGRRAGAEEAGAALVAGARRKAVLERDWEAPRAQPHALPMILDALRAVAHGLETQPAPAETASQVAATMTVAPPGRAHAVVPTPAGTPTLRPGVAAEWRISLAEAERRHGRQRRRRLVAGDKRQGRRALDSRLMGAVGGTPANTPAASVTDARATDVAAHQCTWRAWPLDRAALARPLGPQRSETWAIFCKAWPVHQGPYGPQSAFPLAGARDALRCPGGAPLPCPVGGVVQFPAATCERGTVRERCTASASGRRVSMHPDAALLQEWRERQPTPQGRAQLRERVAVAHALAHVGRWQGRRARDRGGRKHVFALRRGAVVHNVHVLMHLPQTEPAACILDRCSRPRHAT